MFAFFFKGNPVERKKYEWEKDTYNPDNDPFLRQFDDDGNFIELPKEEPLESVEKDLVEQKGKPQDLKVVYTFKKKSSENPQ